MKSPTSRTARVPKKSPAKKLPPKRDTAWAVSIVGLCVLAALVLWSGSIISELALKLDATEYALQSWKTSATGDNNERTKRFTCEGELSDCQGTLASAYDGMTTSSLKYVLDSGAFLSREWTEDETRQELWLVKDAEIGSSASSVRKLVGSFDIISGPAGGNAFSIKRLPNGLYQFVATADYTEGNSETMGLIDSETLRFITFTDSADRQKIVIATPEITNASITPHLREDTCATLSKAVIDRLDWNAETLYQFRKPPTINCEFSELGGGNVLLAFSKIEARAVTRDLKSVVLRLQTGQALKLQFNGAKKPTVTVVQ
jgi:hypothetical protein